MINYLDIKHFKFLVDNFDFHGMKIKLVMNIYHLKHPNNLNCKNFDDIRISVVFLFSYQQAIDLQTEYYQLEQLAKKRE